MSLVVGAITLIFGVAATVTGWRGLTRGFGVDWIFIGLMALNSAVIQFGRSDPRGRVLGTFRVVLAVATLVAGGLLLWHDQKRRS
jgi:hypothetical protein